ncbi:MAG: flagella basal body P-ring formation protein FlgA [Chlamydiales bacterium]|jgi:flagella basal body P-ring formation protein FlgA
MITTLLLALAGNVTIKLPAEAHVTGVEFVLGDIAQVESGDPLVAERFRSLSLGYAPAPGYSRVIEAQAMAREARASFPGLEIEFQGASACRVFSRVQHIEAAAIQALAKAELAQIFGDQDAELDLVGQLLDLQVPQGKMPAKLQVHLRDTTPHAGSWSVPVDVIVDGASVRTVWTSWNVSVWEQREVLVRDIVRGAELGPQDLEQRRTKVQHQQNEAPMDRRALRGAVAKRDMRAGEVVRLNDIERALVIRRGDMVHLEVHNGAITARAAAIAQEDGRIGDRVRIVMSSSRQELTAIASSKGRVEIRMGS